MRSWEAICEFAAGKVYHLMAFAESDGFYRRGKTLCGRHVDERLEDVDIYPDEAMSHREVCKKCKGERASPTITPLPETRNL